MQPPPPHVYGAGGFGFGCGLNMLRPRIDADMWSQVLMSREPAHVRVSWEDKPPGLAWANAKFEVVVYFAPQFAELRRRLVQVCGAVCLGLQLCAVLMGLR